MKATGTVFVDRASSVAGRAAVNKAGKKAKESKISLWIFPEGTRNHSHDGTMLPFKKGAFHVALDVGMPILPIIVSEYDFRNDSYKHIHVRILPEIPTDGISKDHLDDLIAKTRTTMTEALREVNKVAEQKRMELKIKEL